MEKEKKRKKQKVVIVFPSQGVAIKQKTGWFLTKTLNNGAAFIDNKKYRLKSNL